MQLVLEVLDELVLRVLLDVSLEVVSVHLLFLGEVSKEVSVVVNPSFTLLVQHPLFPSLVVVGVGHCSCIELLNFVEDSIELHD